MSIGNMKNKQLNVGDIFYLELRCKNKYVFGRVLFDVDKQYNKIADQSTVGHFPYLTLTYQGCQLIEMYKGIYDTPELKSKDLIIPKVFTRNINGKFNILNWEVVGNDKVDYTKVDFPEHLNDKNGRIVLDRGELSLATNIHNNDDDDLEFASSVDVPATIGDACLHLQGRDDLIDPEFLWPEYITNNDLMYNPDLRKTVYNQIGEDPNASYYELAKAKGFDLARFY